MESFWPVIKYFFSQLLAPTTLKLYNSTYCNYILLYRHATLPPIIERNLFYFLTLSSSISYKSIKVYLARIQIHCIALVLFLFLTCLSCFIFTWYPSRSRSGSRISITVADFIPSSTFYSITTDFHAWQASSMGSINFVVFWLTVFFRIYFHIHTPVWTTAYINQF